MKNIIYIAASLDGYIASKDQGLDWLMNIPNPDNSDYGFSTFMERIDGIIMGRKTFEKVLTFGEWPYSKKVFVLSNTLEEIPLGLEERVEVVNGNITTIVENLNNLGYKSLYIDGGKTIQSFLELNLIDEMIITRASILLGGGVSLFGSLNNSICFKVIKTEILNENLVKTHYIRV